MHDYEEDKRKKNTKNFDNFSQKVLFETDINKKLEVLALLK